jgi:hypothetical protein
VHVVEGLGLTVAGHVQVQAAALEEGLQYASPVVQVIRVPEQSLEPVADVDIAQEPWGQEHEQSLADARAQIAVVDSVAVKQAIVTGQTVEMEVVEADEESEEVTEAEVAEEVEESEEVTEEVESEEVTEAEVAEEVEEAEEVTEEVESEEVTEAEVTEAVVESEEVKETVVSDEQTQEQFPLALAEGLQ